MKMLVKGVFLSEIEWQCQFAERAAEQLQAGAQRSDTIGTWAAVQAILTAAGNVSKILWPPRRESAARGEMLRALLGVGDNNALSDRTFRNHFEHYDERIEDWLTSRSSSTYTDQIIGPLPW